MPILACQAKETSFITSTDQSLRKRQTQSIATKFSKIQQKLQKHFYRCATNKPTPRITESPSTFPSSAPSATVIWSELDSGLPESDVDGTSIAFGTSLALSRKGTSLVVGGTSGSFFLFQSGTSIQEDLSDWTKTDLSFPFSSSNTIQSCDISGDGNFIVAGELSTGSPGKVTVFFNSTLFGGSWQIKGTSLSARVNGDLFGWDVSISDEGDKIIVGAPGARPAYIRVASFFQDDDWVSTDIESTIEGFGLSVSMSNDGATAVVGATEGNGTLEVLDVDNLLNGNETIFEGIGDGFGGAISMSGDGETVIAGTDEGEYFSVYALNTELDDDDHLPQWEQIGDFTFGTSDQSSFGQAVAVSDNGNRVIIGAQTHDVTGSETLDGKVFIYGSKVIPPKFIGVFSTDTPGNFGAAVAMSGDGKMIAVGNPMAGEVRVFQGTASDQ